MGSLQTSGSGSWDVDLSERQHKLATTLRVMVDAAPLGQDDAGMAELSALARRWAAGDETPLDITELLTQAARAQVLVDQRLRAQPLLAARRVNISLERVQAATSLAEILRIAPAELCWAADFDRVLFSRIEGSDWLPVAWHANNPGSPENLAFGEFMKEARIELSNGMIEAEIVRRRIPALVCNASRESRTFSPLIDIAGSRAYVVAPVISGDNVVGLLHADTHATDRRLVESDRIALRAFADGMGLVLERLALVKRLRSQREQISAALAEAERSVDELCTAPVRLVRPDRTVPAQAAASLDGPPDDGLTAREREVFAILVSGATNAQIADRLTVSETTVKSHVKHILRKLRAKNRAEAIALYLASNHRMGVGS